MVQYDPSQPDQPLPGAPAGGPPNQGAVPAGAHARPIPAAAPTARPLPAGSNAAPAAASAAAPRPLPAGGQARPAAAQPILASSLGGNPMVREASDEEAEPELEEIVKRSPPWLVSGIIHMLLLIILGLWMFAGGGEKPLTLNVSQVEEFLDVLDDSPLLMGDDVTDLEEQAITLDNLPEVDDPLATPPEMDLTSPFATTLSTDVVGPIGLALMGRTEGMKKALLSGYGGTPQTEQAVLEGLQWLMRNQRRDGSWSLVGPYTSPGTGENAEAATAMALLAFQGAGHTHTGVNGRSPFTPVVDKGWKFLLKSQDKDGNFFREGPAHHRLYTHAQATIALCELYAMTRDPALKEPAERAVQYCIRAQDIEGGWRYNPGSGSDTSVTGWFVMALQSARMGGLEVPESTLDRVMEFLDRVSADGGRRYGYQGPESTRPSMTAEGLLCRQYLGWKRNDQRLIDGANHLLDNPIRWSDRNAYYWYYATQVLHHMEGDMWNKWNEVMREALPANQVKRGNERGSWEPYEDQWGHQGGRLFVTCLHIYMLEVYYRHLPIYKPESFIK